MLGVSVKVDTRKAVETFSPGLFDEFVRYELRRVIPDLTRRLGAKINDNLNKGLKSRRRLVVKQEMVEGDTYIYGRVTTVSTSEPYMLPIWLEDGTAPHVIRARNASALFFFWEKMGKNVMFKQVNHPGFAGIHYTENAFESMEGEIRRALIEAARKARKGG